MGSMPLSGPFLHMSGLARFAHQHGSVARDALQHDVISETKVVSCGLRGAEGLSPIFMAAVAPRH